MTKVNTILVTGATGFIGSHLLRALLGEGRDATILCRKNSSTWRIDDIIRKVRRLNIDDVNWREQLKSLNIDGIVHMATKYESDEFTTSEIFNTNILLPVELLEYAITRGAKYFVNTDSFYCKQEFASSGRSRYTFSKKCFLDWARNNAAHIHVANMQLEHVYGPVDGAQKFIPTILRMLLDPAVTQINLTEGRQKRDFVYVEDVVDAYLRVICNAEAAKPGFINYETGTGTSIELKRFIELLRHVTKSEKRLNFGMVPYKDCEIMDSHADIANLISLGYRPNIKVEDSIQSLVNFTMQLEGTVND